MYIFHATGQSLEHCTGCCSPANIWVVDYVVEIFVVDFIIVFSVTSSMLFNRSLWSNSMMWGIIFQEIMPSINLQLMILLEALWARKANLYSEKVWIPVMINYCPPLWLKELDVINLLPSDCLVFLRYIILRAKCQLLLNVSLCCWNVGLFSSSNSWSSLGKWGPVLSDKCVTSITVTMTTVFMNLS